MKKLIISCFRKCVSFRCFSLRQFLRKRNLNILFGKLSTNGDSIVFSRASLVKHVHLQLPIHISYFEDLDELIFYERKETRVLREKQLEPV